MLAMLRCFSINKTLPEVEPRNKTATDIKMFAAVQKAGYSKNKYDRNVGILA